MRLAAGLLASCAATWAAIAALNACAPAPHVQRPPARYQGDRTVVAILTRDPARVCASLGATAAEGRTIVACHHAGTLVLLNPCLLPAAEGDWSDDGCHELAHANGWPANHPAQ